MTTKYAPGIAKCSLDWEKQYHNPTITITTTTLRASLKLGSTKWGTKKMAGYKTGQVKTPVTVKRERPQAHLNWELGVSMWHKDLMMFAHYHRPCNPASGSCSAPMTDRSLKLWQRAPLPPPRRLPQARSANSESTHCVTFIIIPGSTGKELGCK